MKYDAVIIGSGLGGLECGHILSQAGMSVLLLEKEAQAGGCIQSYKRHGKAFDTGFHYVGGLAEGQTLHTIFKMLGLLQLPWKQLDNDFDRITIGDRTFAFTQGYEGFVDTLAKEFPAERKALNSYVKVLKRSAEQELASMQKAQDEMQLSFTEDFEINAWQYLNETFHDQLLINVLSGTSLKMELRKESLPLFTFAHCNNGFIESSWRLKGDGSLIADSLANDIRANGGEIICNAKVEELVEKDGKLVQAICSNGETYEGSYFISDIHPVITSQLVKQSSRMSKIYRKRIGYLENTFGMFTVSLSIKPQTLRYFNWNQYVYKRPNVWTFYQEEGAVSGMLISCRAPESGEYTEQVDLLTPMTWDKCSQWEGTKIGHRGDEYKAMKEQMADECITLAEQFIPEIRSMITGCYTSTPLTYHDYTNTPEGSAYGIRKDFSSPLATMLSPRTPIPNLLLTGQNLMLHGLHGVTITSLFTCAEIIGKEHIWGMMNK